MDTSEQNKPKLTSAFDLFPKSRELVMKNLRVFGWLYLLPFLFSLGDVFSQSKAAKTGDPVDSLSKFSGGGLATLVGFGIAIILASIVVLLFVQAMLFVLELQVAQNKTPNMGELWQTAKHYFWRLLGLGILVGVFIIGGLILFIVPGLFALRRYFLSPYYLVDKDLTISEAMKQSAAESKEFSGSIWGVLGVALLMGLFGIVPIVGSIISLVLGALYSVAPALRYLEIKKAKS